MSDLPIRPQVLEAIRRNQQAVTDASVIHKQGAGMAYQAIAQSAAFAVQDATDYLRNVSLLGSTTIAAAAAKMVEAECGEPWGEIIAEAQRTVDRAVATFGTVGATVKEVLGGFPIEEAESTEPDYRER